MPGAHAAHFVMAKFIADNSLSCCTVLSGRLLLEECDFNLYRGTRPDTQQWFYDNVHIVMGKPSLLKTEIKGWWLPLSYTAPDQNLSWLSRDELARSERQTAKRRHQYIMGRLLLRAALSDIQPDCPPQNWQLPAEGPLRISGDHLTASLSHCQDYLCCIVARGITHLGIDIEQPRSRRNIQGIADHWFTKNEAAYLATLPTEQKSHAFYILWTAKEAYLKALGQGISGGLHRLQGKFFKGECTAFTLSEKTHQTWALEGYWQPRYYLSVIAANMRSTECLPTVSWGSGKMLLLNDASENIPDTLYKPERYTVTASKQ